MLLKLPPSHACLEQHKSTACFWPLNVISHTGSGTKGLPAPLWASSTLMGCAIEAEKHRQKTWGQCPALKCHQSSNCSGSSGIAATGVIPQELFIHHFQSPWIDNSQNCLVARVFCSFFAQEQPDYNIKHLFQSETCIQNISSSKRNTQTQQLSVPFPTVHLVRRERLYQQAVKTLVSHVWKRFH